MIEDLIREYHTLRERGLAPEYGWSRENVPFGIRIDTEGTVKQIIPLGDHGGVRPSNIIPVPAHVSRSSGITANFLCDNATYLLGDEGKGNPKRAMNCFQACAELHHEVLDGLDSEKAKAVLAFFSREPQWRSAKELVGEERWETIAPMNFVLCVDSPEPASCDIEIQGAWNRHQAAQDSSLETMQSFASGNPVVPEFIHPKIKGVQGAQSSGGSLVSFNAPAFCSYGREQCLNAPLSKQEAFEYTTALNALLADRKRRAHIGDATVICWAESGQPEYQDVMSFCYGANNDSISENDVNAIVHAIAKGTPCSWHGFELNPDEHFYVLGLSPNAARISVRFYLKDNFGQFIRNIEQHYEDVRIIRPTYDSTVNPSLWRLLRETVNQKAKDKNPSSQLAGAMLRAILNGDPYPYSLISAVNIRIRAERNITPDKAAIIKGYYTRLARQRPGSIHLSNPNDIEAFKEALQMDINEYSTYVPNVLGRMFSLYEQIQKAANPNINATIKDKYFSAAAATPATIFPILGRLSQTHLRKLPVKRQVWFSQQLEPLAVAVGDRYPSRLTLPEQGAFQLGYYQQNQRQYTSLKSQINDTTQKENDHE